MSSKLATLTEIWTSRMSYRWGGHQPFVKKKLCSQNRQRNKACHMCMSVYKVNPTLLKMRCYRGREAHTKICTAVHSLFATDWCRKLIDTCIFFILYSATFTYAQNAPLEKKTVLLKPKPKNQMSKQKVQSHVQACMIGFAR